MLTEIHAKHLTLWVKVMCMEEHRWPKKTRLAMIVQGSDFTWQIHMGPFIGIDECMHKQSNVAMNNTQQQHTQYLEL